MELVKTQMLFNDTTVGEIVQLTTVTSALFHRLTPVIPQSPFQDSYIFCWSSWIIDCMLFTFENKVLLGDVIGVTFVITIDEQLKQESPEGHGSLT